MALVSPNASESATNPSEAVPGFPTGCIAGVVDFILRLTPTSPVPPAAIVPLTTAGYALPLCTNVMATGLISFKIWHTTRLRKGDAALHSTTRLARNAIAIIVESGALYLATQLVFVVLVNTTQPAQAIVAVMAVQIYVSSAPVVRSRPASAPVGTSRC